MEKKSASSMDLHDSEDDKKHLQLEEAILDLPDVKDIPGQENIKVPKFGEMADTTTSSSDEEGDELFNDEFGDESADESGASSDITATERKLLRNSARQTSGDESESDVRRASLDRTDGDGDPLNEADLTTDRFGEDLDIPESEEVDEEDSSD